MDDQDPHFLEKAVEAILFASEKPLSKSEIGARLAGRYHGGAKEKAEGDEGEFAQKLSEALDALSRHYQNRGVELCKIGGRFAFRTVASISAHLQLETEIERKLSRAAIETLAIIAYHGGITRAEIEEIRGVSVSRGTLDQLLELGWIRLGKRRDTPGRPATFLTTTSFLDHFGLSSTKDLPGIKELRAAGILDREAPGSDDIPELAANPAMEDADNGDEEQSGASAIASGHE